MNWISKLERKFGRYSISNLTFYVVTCYVVGYLLQQFNPAVLSMLSLNVSKILHGQIWRLFTWVISPPSSSSFMWFIIAIFFFYYPLGKMLERTWGDFRYNLYIFSGMFFTVISAFLLHFITGGAVDYLAPIMYSTYYISLSIFLAYAMTCPDMQILLMFVIPIKMKWMAYVYGALIIYDIISYVRDGLWFMAVPIVASLLNFLIFFFSGMNIQRYHPKEVKRRNDFKKAMAQSRVYETNGNISKHKCAICGRTEKDDPNLEFRFCSKCNGNYEYCQDHLFTHKHVE